MGADLLLAYIPAARMTNSRRRILHRLIDRLSDRQIHCEEIEAIIEEQDARQFLHEQVDQLPDEPWKMRNVLEMALPHIPYPLLFTGGDSWGESPGELFDALCGAPHNASSVALFVMWRPVNSSRKAVAALQSFAT